MRCPLSELDQTFEAYVRPSFDVVMEALKTAPHVRYWCRDEEDEGPSDCRETPLESDAFRLSEEGVMNEHGDDAFVVRLHVFSDSCAISGSQGSCIAKLCCYARDCALVVVCRRDFPPSGCDRCGHF